MPNVNVNAYANTTIQGAMFSFQPNGTILYSDYKNNAKSLQWLNNVIVNNKLAIIADKAYFQIIAFLPQIDVNNPVKENNASFQAHVLRSYLLTQYGIQNAKCTFAIDTTQKLENVVNLQLIPGKPAPYENKEIIYAQNKNYEQAYIAMSKYKTGVPYMSYFMHVAKKDINFANGGEFYALNNGAWIKIENFDTFAESASLAQIAETATELKLYVKLNNGIYRPATVNEINDGIEILYIVNKQGLYSVATEEDIRKVAKKYHLQTAKNNNYIAALPKINETKKQQIIKYPVHEVQEQKEIDTRYTTQQSTTKQQQQSKQQTQQQSITTQQQNNSKTEKAVKVKNLLDYSRTKPIFAIKTNILQWCIGLPNIQTEFFAGSMLSLNLEAAYTWLTPLFAEQKAYYQWNLGAELKFWFNNNKRFEGMFIGPYASTGQYDIKFKDEGNQGDYYTVGLLFGTLVPINRHFNMEFGIGVGYYNYNNIKYYYSDGKFIVSNPLAPVNQKSGFFPSKASISLVWKF